MKVQDNLWSHFHLRFSGLLRKIAHGVILLMVQKFCVHQLRLVVYPTIFKVFYIPGGAGFLPSTGCSTTFHKHVFIEIVGCVCVCWKWPIYFRKATGDTRVLETEPWLSGICKWWFFTDSTMLNHHRSPPCGRICLELVPSILSNSKFNGWKCWNCHFSHGILLHRSW